MGEKRSHHLGRALVRRKIRFIPIGYLMRNFLGSMFAAAFITHHLSLCNEGVDSSAETSSNYKNLLTCLLFVYMAVNVVENCFSIWLLVWKRNPLEKRHGRYGLWFLFSAVGFLIKLGIVVTCGATFSFQYLPTWMPIFICGSAAFLLLDLISLLIVFNFLDYAPSFRSPVHTLAGNAVSSYYDKLLHDPVNSELGRLDDLYHHHYGVGPVQLQGDNLNEEEIKVELHRLETAQAHLLLENLGGVEQKDRVLDAGCGRGGSCIMAAEKFGCFVDGVTISQRQAAFASKLIESRGLGSRITIHFRNMLNTGFPSESFKAIWNNESTMYVDLAHLFTETRRLLIPGGRYVCITGAFTGTHKSESVRAIDKHYSCRVHKRKDYFEALLSHGLLPLRYVNLTQDTLPYWKLREKSALATGIEKHFIKSFEEGSFMYIMIVAEKIS